MPYASIRPYVRPIDVTSPESIDVQNTPQTNIAAFPFRGDAIDQTANHVINNGVPAFSANGLYGYNTLDTTPGNFGINALNIGGGVAHQIPNATPVSFGCLHRLIAGSGATPYVLSSSFAGGGGNHNYSLVYIGGQLHFQSGPGGGVATIPLPFIPGFDRFFHICAVLPGGRATITLYIDGIDVSGPLATGAAGAPVGTDDLHIANVGLGVPAGGLSGYMRNAFITNTQLTQPQIATLVNEAYGLNKV